MAAERIIVTTDRRSFLTAEWRDLLLLNYEIDPSLLEPLVPAGTQLDSWNGRTLISLVGFRFLRTRVLGCAVPLHGAFEEVNLRFYVRRCVADGPPRRGVVFVREIVPRRAVAWVARSVYGEPYQRLPMAHRVGRSGAGHPEHIEYAWKFHRDAWRMAGRIEGPSEPLTRPSEAEFVSEHYWGYTRQPDGATLEYEIDHSPWNVAPVVEPRFEAPNPVLYGEAFTRVLTRPPHSAFYAEGSAVTVFRGSRVPG
jgi:Uncharacterized conserved protein